MNKHRILFHWNDTRFEVLTGYCWKLKISGMWCCVIPNMSKAHSGRSQSKAPWSSGMSIFSHPVTTVSHSSRPEFLSEINFNPSRLWGINSNYCPTQTISKFKMPSNAVTGSDKHRLAARKELTVHTVYRGKCWRAKYFIVVNIVLPKQRVLEFFPRGTAARALTST